MALEVCQGAMGRVVMPQAPGDSRQRILQIALRMFSDRGYGGTSLQAVADELALTKASVYYHFPAKGELLEALAQPCLERLAAIVTDPPDTSELADCRALLDAYLATAADYSAEVALLIADPTASTLPPAVRCRAQRGALLDLLARAGSPPVGRVLATCSSGAVESAVFGVPSTETAVNRSTILDAAMRALGGAPDRAQEGSQARHRPSR